MVRSITEDRISQPQPMCSHNRREGSLKDEGNRLPSWLPFTCRLPSDQRTKRALLSVTSWPSGSVRLRQRMMPLCAERTRAVPVASSTTAACSTWKGGEGGERKEVAAHDAIVCGAHARSACRLIHHRCLLHLERVGNWWEEVGGGRRGEVTATW